MIDGPHATTDEPGRPAEIPTGSNSFPLDPTSNDPGRSTIPARHARLAMLSQLAYWHEEKLVENQHIFRRVCVPLDARVNTFEHRHMAVLYVETDRELIVAIRGSDDSNDWISNVAPIRRWIRQNEYSQRMSYGHVHNGFQGNCNLIGWPVCTRIRVALGNHKSVRLCGHSAGGAAAVLIALNCAAIEGLHVNEVLTIGAPRALCPDAAYEYRRHGLNLLTTQYVYGRDPVPHLPTMLQYEHVGHHVLIRRDGRLIEYPTMLDWSRQFAGSLIPWSIGLDHSTTHYVGQMLTLADGPLLPDSQPATHDEPDTAA